MNKEEIEEYLKRTDDLSNKLYDEDRDTFEWLVYGYNQCAKILCEKEELITKTLEFIEKETAGYDEEPIDGTWLSVIYKIRDLLKGDKNE